MENARRGYNAASAARWGDDRCYCQRALTFEIGRSTKGDLLARVIRHFLLFSVVINSRVQ